MAVPIIRSITESRTTSNATTFTVTMPTSRPDGRLFLLMITVDGGDPISDPSGWTRIARISQGSTNPVSCWIGYKIGSSEPSTYTVNTDASASERFGAVVLGIDRFDTTTPINTSSSNSGASSTPASSSINTTANDCLAIWAMGCDGTSSYSSTVASHPSSYVDISQVTPSSDAGVTVAGKNQVSAGTVSGANGSLLSTDDWIVFSVAVAGDLASPEITSATSAVPSYIDSSETGVVLTGTAFEASKGSGKLELWSDATGSVKTVQTTTAWSDTSITFSASLGSISQGRMYAVVTTNGGKVGEPFRVVVLTGAPDTKIVEVRVSANTSTGDQDITSSEISGITPKAVLFRMIRATASGVEDHLGICVGGAASSSARFAAAAKSEDAIGTTNEGRAQYDNACLASIDPASSAQESKADFVSFVSGGCRINWSDAPPAAYLIVATFFCGSLVQANVNNLTVDISRTPSSTAVRIQQQIAVSMGDPDFVFSVNVTQAAFNGISVTTTPFAFGVAALGAFDLGASIQQGGMKAIYTDGATTTSSSLVAYTDGFVDFNAVGSSNGRLAGRRWIMDRDVGYSLYIPTLSFAPIARSVSFLELILPGTRCWAGSVNPKTSSGDQAITSPGWLPQWIFSAQTMAATLGTAETDDDANSFSITSFTSTTQQATGVSTDDGSTGADVASFAESKAIFLRDAPTGVLFDGSFVSMDSTGWTWNFATANGTQRRWIAAAIEGFASGGGAVTIGIQAAWSGSNGVAASVTAGMLGDARAGWAEGLGLPANVASGVSITADARGAWASGASVVAQAVAGATVQSLSARGLGAEQAGAMLAGATVAALSALGRGGPAAAALIAGAVITVQGANGRGVAQVSIAFTGDLASIIQRLQGMIFLTPTLDFVLISGDQLKGVLVLDEE